MFGNKKQITFYYLDNLLQIRKIRWVRLKIVGIVIGAVTFCLGVLLTVNSLYYNFLGLGNSRMQTIMQENQILRNQLVAMNDQMNHLQTKVKKIADQADQLRLVVDLPVIDEETKAAGTGGTVIEPDMDLPNDGSSQILQTAKDLVRTLSSELKVQEQSYEQIADKVEFNKKYFTAFPAIKPMNGFYSLNEFGMRMHPVLGIKKMHEGLDIVNDVGTPVIATGDGVVQLAGHTGGGFGYAVVINHGYGYQTVYAHLSKILVHENQRVERGDLIAKSGRSGLVSGPHLHYEVRHNGISQNPLDYFFDDVSIGEYRKQVALH